MTIPSKSVFCVTDPADHGTVIAAEITQTSYILPGILGERVSGGQDWQEFHELSSGHTTSGSNGTVTAPSMTPPCHYTCGRHSLGQPPVSWLCPVPLVDRQHVL